MIRLGPELEKVEKELANYRRFGELCRELVTLNEKICRLRPVPQVSDAGTGGPVVQFFK